MCVCLSLSAYDCVLELLWCEPTREHNAKLFRNINNKRREREREIGGSKMTMKETRDSVEH